MEQVFERFWNKSFCQGLIEWTDTNSFYDISSKPIWERNTDIKIVFEDQKLADLIFSGIKEKLPQENAYGRLMGVDDYLRIFRFGRGSQLFNPEDLTRSRKEKIYYRVLIFLNDSKKQMTLSLDNTSLEIKAGTALLCSNSCHLNLDNSANLYLLMADITYRK
jgi:hypothetical protein